MLLIVEIVTRLSRLRRESADFASGDRTFADYFFTSGEVTLRNVSSMEEQTSTTAGLPQSSACCKAGASSSGDVTLQPSQPIARAIAA